MGVEKGFLPAQGDSLDVSNTAGEVWPQVRGGVRALERQLEQLNLATVKVRTLTRSDVGVNMHATIPSIAVSVLLGHTKSNHNIFHIGTIYTAHHSGNANVAVLA